MNHRRGSNNDWQGIWFLVALFAVGGCIDQADKAKKRDEALTQARDEALTMQVTIDVLRRQLLEAKLSPAGEPIETYQALVPPAEDTLPNELNDFIPKEK